MNTQNSTTGDNEWKNITQALNSAGMEPLTHLTDEELTKLELMLWHWQKIARGALDERHKS